MMFQLQAMGYTVEERRFEHSTPGAEGSPTRLDVATGKFPGPLHDTVIHSFGKGAS